MDEKTNIIIGEYSYDVTDYKHPGGNIIKYMSGQDATNAFEEFHYRSKKARAILQSLPRTKIEHTDQKDTTTTEQKMLEDFVRFRKSLEDRGFFNPSYFHITYRILELFAIYSFAIWSMQYSIAASIVLLGLFGGRCGWVQHEGGHNSFTGNINTDKIVQNVFIGFGLLADGSMWNSMHNKHHAATQKIGYDMDLDTAPFVLFYPRNELDVKKQIMDRFGDKCEENVHSTYEIDAQRSAPLQKSLQRILELLPLRVRRSSQVSDKIPNQIATSLLDKAVKLWLKYQVYTFLPITSGVFVMLFWLLYLHPRKIIRDRNATQAVIVTVGHVSRILLFMRIGEASFYQALWYHFITLWVSGVYLFGQFSLSHTFMPVIESNENPNWVRYSLEHTVDIEPQNYAVSWIMGHLNNQVVHHLFPSMPQYRGPEVSKELIEFCKKWDLKYTIITYREAWNNMFANLRKVGGEVYERMD
jgi:fatty acid desaturase